MKAVVRGILVLVSVAVLAACAWDPPRSYAPTTTREVPKDTNLRPVTMTYRDGLVYTAGETSAQALCHALSAQEWRAMLGGAVGRTIQYYDECVADTGSLYVQMSMELDEPDVQPRDREPETISGYPAWTEPDGVLVTLDAAPKSIWARPYLYIEAAGPDQRDLLRRLASTLLDRLAHNGPPTPVADSQDILAFTETKPVPGTRLFDLPEPVQALVLCTAMLRTGAPDVTYVDMAGQCSADDRRAAITDHSQAESAGFTIANHPATFVHGGGITIDLVELPPDDSGHRVHLYLKLEWSRADRRKTKKWATHFVTHLGDL